MAVWGSVSVAEGAMLAETWCLVQIALISVSEDDYEDV